MSLYHLYLCKDYDIKQFISSQLHIFHLENFLNFLSLFLSYLEYKHLSYWCYLFYFYFCYCYPQIVRPWYLLIFPIRCLQLINNFVVHGLSSVSWATVTFSNAHVHFAWCRLPIVIPNFSRLKWPIFGLSWVSEDQECRVAPLRAAGSEGVPVVSAAVIISWLHCQKTEIQQVAAGRLRSWLRSGESVPCPQDHSRQGDPSPAERVAEREGAGDTGIVSWTLIF